MSMRIVARAALAVLMLTAAWGCTVDYHAAPAPYDRASLTEREWARLNAQLDQIRQQLSADLNQTREQLADTRAELDALRGRLNAAEGAVQEMRSGAGPGAGSERTEELARRLSFLETEVRTQRELLKERENELRQLREALARSGNTPPPAAAAAQEPQVKAPVTPRPGQAAASRPARAATPPPVQARAGQATAAAQRDYEDAWKRLRERDYRGAIQQFRKFVKDHPGSSLTDNAQYWIGESHYALQQFDEAILQFDEVRKKYPNGDKVPAALLKIGYAFAEIGNRVDARLIFQEVINRYPRSREAEKAREKIRDLDT